MSATYPQIDPTPTPSIPGARPPRKSRSVRGAGGVGSDVRLVRVEQREATETRAFVDFYELERHGAIRLAWLLTHDASTAEDVVQDAFTAVFARFDGLETPAAYLRKVVINAVYTRSRHAGREARRMRLVGRDVPASVDGPTGGLADAIARLPLNQRTAIVLRYWADLDHESIAEAMGIRPSSVRSLCTRATAQLRKDFT